MAGPTPSPEEREIILRDKAAREGLTVPDEVIGYIAQHRYTDQALKSALINLSAYAYRKQQPITLSMAEYVLEGVRPSTTATAVVAEEDTIEETPETSETLSQYPMPSFLTGYGSTLSEELDAREAAAVAPTEVPEYEHLNDEDIAALTAVEPIHPAEVPELAEEFPEPPIAEPEPGPTEASTLFAENAELSAAYQEVVKLNEEDMLEEELEEDEHHPLHSPEHTLVGTQSQPEARPSELGADVYFAPMATEQKRSLVERAGAALERAGLAGVVSPGDFVAIKIHCGEAGNTAFVSPIYVRKVVQLVKELGGRPFLTDANTLYSGQRANAVDHTECALHNGFSYATVEAPFIVADGLHGRDFIDVRVDGKHCPTVRIGSAAVEADAMVVISHVKGHGVAGFGGAVKNVGMGLGSRSAKQRMHSDVQPMVEAAKCTRCNRCVQWCPVQAITIDDSMGAARIDYSTCYGCGECVAACNTDAIAISLETDPNVMQEKMVEHAAGVARAKRNKMIYLSFLTNITPECDCWRYSDAPLVPDIGLMASRDMVAIDQAAYDLIVQAVGNVGSRAEDMGAGVDKFTKIHGTDGTRVISYGEEFGLGTRRYTLHEIG
ncbi:MAG: DUF362 domain-containing protein [Coriobacteriia bacterium]|nr:DUF362 domain-containing protein [Coriobacteriia bacterium]